LISVYHFASSPHLTTLFALPSSPCPAVHVDVRQLLAWPRSDLTNIASEQNFSDHALRRVHTYLPSSLLTAADGAPETPSRSIQGSHRLCSEPFIHYLTLVHPATARISHLPSPRQSGIQSKGGSNRIAPRRKTWGSLVLRNTAFQSRPVWCGVFDIKKREHKQSPEQEATSWTTRSLAKFS
jgi:hypothetical protein